MKVVKQFKLPTTLATNPTAAALRDFMSKLGPNSGYITYLLYKKNNQYYFVQKDLQFPFIPFDWTMFSLMRAHAKTIVNSGLSLRDQAKIFGDDRGAFGNAQINQIYAQNKTQPFNLLLHTKTMTRADVEKIISKKSFKYITMEELGVTNLSFKESANKINSLGIGPVIYEYGQNLFEKSMNDVKQDEPNFLQTIVLSLMEGPLDSKYIGKQYQMNIINRDFSKVWESEVIKSSYDNKNAANSITLKYEVYTRKPK